MGVSTNKKQTNHIKDDHIHRNTFAQWGIPVILLLIVLIVMVTNFCVISRNEANASINNRLVMEAGTYAAGIERRLSITTSAANAIAAMSLDSASQKQETKTVTLEVPTNIFDAFVEWIKEFANKHGWNLEI